MPTTRTIFDPADRGDMADHQPAAIGDICVAYDPFGKRYVIGQVQYVDRFGIACYVRISPARGIDVSVWRKAIAPASDFSGKVNEVFGEYRRYDDYVQKLESVYAVAGGAK